MDSKFQPFTTIRHNECELLLPESATAKSCSKCEAYRKTLHAMASRYHKQQKACDDKTSPQSHTNYRFLSPLEKAQRLYRMHNAIHASRKQVQKLKAKIADISERRAVQVSKEMHDVFRRSCGKMSHKLARNTLQNHSHTFFGSSR